MPLNAAQQAEMTKAKQQLTELKDTVMRSPLCTMGGMGNYLFEAFKNLEAQLTKVEQA